jgi:hypothetical protein
LVLQASEADKNMKVLTLALMLSLPVAQLPLHKPLPEPSLHTARRSTGGRWYFAATGHAVYCYGPVMIIPDANGDLEKVATFCRDGSAVVPLYESPDPVRPAHKDQKQGKTPARPTPRFPQM